MSTWTSGPLAKLRCSLSSSENNLFRTCLIGSVSFGFIHSVSSASAAARILFHEQAGPSTFVNHLTLSMPEKFPTVHNFLSAASSKRRYYLGQYTAAGDNT